MKIESAWRVQHAPSRVFAAFRDHMPEVCAFIPDVREIITRDRSVDGQVTRVQSEWVSDREVPAFATAFLKPEHLRWDDDAAWDADRQEARWTLTTRAFTEAVRCSGTTRIVADGEGSRVEIDGDLTIAVEQLPGIPNFLAKRIAPRVEQFIIQLITPNLVETNRAIERFLDAHPEVGCD